MKVLPFLICFCIMAFQRCKPDSNTPCRMAHIFETNFSDEEKSKFPFAGKNDTLRYINTNGDSIWCIGAEKMLYFKTFPVKNNPDCPDDSIGFTILQFNYADSLNKLSFTATVYKYDSLLTINANNSIFSLPMLKIGVNDSVSWFDSLQFGTRIFYHINSYLNANGDSMYYNAGYGMIALKHGAQHFYIYGFNSK